MIDEMDLGMVAMHLLYHGSQEKVQPAAMTDELDTHGYEYDRDEIERGLRNLVAKGLMETDEQQYWTTEDGEAFLAEMKEKAAQVRDEILNS